MKPAPPVTKTRFFGKESFKGVCDYKRGDLGPGQGCIGLLRRGNQPWYGTGR